MEVLIQLLQRHCLVADGNDARLHCDNERRLRRSLAIRLDRNVSRLDQFHHVSAKVRWLHHIITRAHHIDEIPERDVTYHLTCLLIYHGTTTHL